MIKPIQTLTGAFCLSGKTALVTGGGKGIGAAIALAMAESGANIAIADIAEAAETIAALSKFGGACKSYLADVSSLPAVERLVDDAWSDFGGIDILVNNAGTSAVGDLLDDDGLADWNRVMGLNLGGNANMIAAVGKRMRDAGAGGAIINISSISSEFVVRTQNMSAYCVSKAGINSLTKCMAYELGKYDIRVNAIAPAFTNTDLSKMIPPDQVAYINGTFALGRFNEPIEIGALAVYLASPASAQITGAVIPINGGFALSV
ncbi:MAG: SDR family oxidoreductase [Clostridiales Family XIII bacterium]|jgi:NAD(P)-dependent dehydrogenase (short-subunit alcohol dehydrogenase family)|nr:SDR family oxidoreductase [Clostridiales Family XIII bacterium]